MTDLITPWTGLLREAEYLTFVRCALGNDELRGRYRDATGDQFEPAANGAAMNEQVASGEAFAYLTRFSDWLAANVFGSPDEVGRPIVVGRVLH